MSDINAAGGHEASAGERDSGEGTASSGATGNMNAHDIPRYNSEGYVLGRPQTANDPASAGGIQGAADGQANGSTQAMPGADPAMGQPGVQPPPQGAVYGGMDPAYGQAMPGVNPAMGQPGVQPPPQGTVYGGMDPAYGQAMPGVNPAMGQPGMQVPPQGMAYGGADPAYQQVPPGYGPAQPDPAAETASAENYGRIADVVNDIANGEQPDVNKLASLFSGFDAQFWKGALIGAVLTALLTNETVKTAVAGTIGGIVGSFKNEGTPEGEASPAGKDAT